MSDIYSAADAAKITFQTLMEWVSGAKEIHISTGFDCLDSHLCGFQPGKVTVLASKPSAGKTAYALNVVRNMLHKDSTKGILYCSPDLDLTQFMLRFFCIECGLEATQLLQGEFGDQSLQKITPAVTWIKDLPLWIDPSCEISVEELNRKIRRFLKKHPLDLVVIDPAELLKCQESSSVFKNIRQIARKFQLSILLLTVCPGENKRCSLQNLPNEIVDNSDTVIFLERVQTAAASEKEKVSAELIIARNRCGFTGTIPMEYEAKTMIFTETTPDECGK